MATVDYKVILTKAGKFLAIPTLMSLPALWLHGSKSATLSLTIASVLLVAALTAIENNEDIGGFKGSWLPICSWVAYVLLCIGRAAARDYLPTEFSLRKAELFLAFCVYTPLIFDFFSEKNKIYWRNRRAMKNYQASGE